MSQGGTDLEPPTAAGVATQAGHSGVEARLVDRDLLAQQCRRYAGIRYYSIMDRVRSIRPNLLSALVMPFDFDEAEIA